jgi:hypothetical protein
MNEELKHRLKSFLWRTAMLMIALFLTELGNNIGLFELDEMPRLLLGLMAGELSKYLNNKYNELH